MRALAVLVLTAAALAVAPATASALSCPISAPLADYESADAAFVGQPVERRGNVLVMSVLDGVKGVASGETVEVVHADGFPMVPPPATEPEPVSWPPSVVFADVVDGRLFTSACRGSGTTPAALRSAAAAAGQGRTCAGEPPRIIWAVPTVTGRALMLRIVFADGDERAYRVKVEWGAQFGVEGLPRTTRRAPRSHTLLVRHRYATSGEVRVRVSVTPRPPLLCGYRGAGSSRELTARLGAARRSATRD